MKQCPQCGVSVGNDEHTCHNCGQSLKKEINQKSSKNNNIKRKDRTNKSTAQSSNIKLRKIVPVAIIFFIIILLVILFFLLKNYNSPNAQAKILVNAIDNDDNQKVATLLGTKDKKVDPDEAAAYIKYIKKEVGMKHFVKDVRNTVDKLNKSDSSVASYIQTKDGQDILRVSKNGRRYFIFDNMSFNAPTKQPIVKPKVDTKYEFKSGGKRKTVIADANKTTPLGYFIPGNYHIDATKETKNGVFTGTLDFNFKNSNSETVDVNENFEEAHLNIKLKGATKLTSKSKKIIINDRTMSYSNSKEFGPYPKNKDITISAQGKAKGKTFESETKTIKASNLKDNTSVTLDFDSDEISKYVTKKEKEENSLKNKLTQFFSGYSMALTSAKNQSNFDLISSYFKKNSSMYDKMKNSISNQQLVSLQSPQVLSASKSGDKILTTVQHIDENGQYVNKEYELEQASSGNDFNLIKETD